MAATSSSDGDGPAGRPSVSGRIHHRRPRRKRRAKSCQPTRRFIDGGHARPNLRLRERQWRCAMAAAGPACAEAAVPGTCRPVPTGPWMPKLCCSLGARPAASSLRRARFSTHCRTPTGQGRPANRAPYLRIDVKQRPRSREAHIVANAIVRTHSTDESQLDTIAEPVSATETAS